MVVDGDVVASVPKNAGGYRHAGTSVIMDTMETGNIIVDPSFVERFFRTKKVYLGVSVHKLSNYEGCLEAVKKASGATGVTVSSEMLAAAQRRKSDKQRSTSIDSKDALQKIIRDSIARQSQRRGTEEVIQVTQSPIGHPRLSVKERSSILNDL